MKRKTEMHITVLLDMIVLTTIIIVTSASASLDLDNSSPVYRMWSLSQGDHFYTTNYDESKSAVKCGYKEEGILGYCAASP